MEQPNGNMSYPHIITVKLKKLIPHSSVVDGNLPSTVHNLIVEWREPWFIHPIQTGTILNPKDSDMEIGTSQTSRVCHPLPRGVPRVEDKDIEGTAGYWCVNGFSEVTDEGGTVIGNKTSYTLVFGDKYHDNSGRNVKGMWSAEEFICVNSEVDEESDSSIVALYCKNNKLKSLELSLTLYEYDFAGLIHKNMNNNKPGEGVQIYFDDHVGSYIRMVEEERRDARDKEERIARWVLGSEGKLEPDLLDDESELYMNQFDKDSNR
ncbi:hypothetical protein Tco_0025713 [Tanacetum coccineum]